MIIKLGQMRHDIRDDQTILVVAIKEARDFHRTHAPDHAFAVIDLLERLRGRLDKRWDMLNTLIEEA
jgi:hypothetical protein